MTTLHEAAMRQALEALEKFEVFRRIMTDGPDTSDKLLAEDYAEMAFVQGPTAIEALRSALAQQVEPVAWAGVDLDGMVEALNRVTEAQGQRTPFHQPMYSDAMMAMRELRGLVGYMKRHDAPAPQAQQPQYVSFMQLGGCPFCGKSNCVAGQCRKAAPQAQRPPTASLLLNKSLSLSNSQESNYETLSHRNLSAPPGQQEAPRVLVGRTRRR